MARDSGQALRGFAAESGQVLIRANWGMRPPNPSGKLRPRSSEVYSAAIPTQLRALR